VVLLDEIDKAQPDVPNDLLEAIDRRGFTVRDTQQRVDAPGDLEVLIVITTNGERDLPPAFMRRCVCHEIRFPADSAELLTDIARRHFTREEIPDLLLGEVYRRYAELRADADARRLREPSTAELIDALRACHRLKLERADEDPTTWLSVVDAALWKHAGKPPVPATGVAATPASAAHAAKDAP
jgi:MoxR-like ATPase